MGDQIDDAVKVEEPEPEKKESEVKPVDHTKERKRNKDEKSKKKDDRRPAEQFLRGLNDVHSVEDKLEAICKKYSEIVEENRKFQLTLKQYDKKMLMLQREKEQFQSERSKSALTRRRLESLCRELQKQNKAIKEESLQKIREQEEMRKELSETVQGGLGHITALMTQNIEKNAKVFEENLELNKKFKVAYEDIELREQEWFRAYHQMHIEMQAAKTELEKVRLEATQEKETLLKEKKQLLCKLTEYQAQIKELQAAEVGLRSQISIYTDKYDEFQNVLSRSNKVYGEFNDEMEKMSKKILLLEKETCLWKQRCESSHAALLEMAADKQMRDSEIATLKKEVSILRDLCKVYESGRKNLLAEQKQKNKTSKSEEVAPKEKKPKENTKPVKQVDDSSKDCVKLQNGFGQLQDALSKVTEDIQKGLRDGTSEGNASEQKDSSEVDNRIDSLKTETESTIGEFNEAVDSVCEQSEKNSEEDNVKSENGSDKVTCTDISTSNNEKPLDKEAAPTETVNEIVGKDNDIVTEPVITPPSTKKPASKEQSAKTSLTKTNHSETKNSEPIKSGRRRRK